MNSVCPICGNEFESQRTSKRPRKYCSHECYRKANIKQVNKRKKIRIEESRLEWAKNEARDILRMASTLTVDQLAYYIYNNYNKRSK